MLNVHFVLAEYNMDGEIFRRILRGMLNHDSWRPLGLTIEQSFAGMAELQTNESLRFISASSSRGGYAGFSPPGDVFLRPDAIVFILNVSDPRRREAEYAYQLLRLSPAWRRRGVLPSAILAGIVAPEEVDANDILADFLRAFEEQVQAISQAKPSLYWKPIDLDLPQLEKLLERLTGEGTNTRFSTPELDEVVVAAADVLSDQENRELLRELSAAGFGRKDDILARREAKKDEVEQALSELSKAGLTQTEFLLQCRSTSSPLARFATKDEYTKEPIASLRCGKCPKRYSEELLSEGYSVSKLGRSLTQGSHWMTVWVTKRLLNLGIPIGSIVWNLEDSGEEVDIIMEFMGRLWIFELKDREFGPGDAHPFNYRRVRYGANEGFIITTDKVSADARRVFGDLAASSLQRKTEPPTMIEGLENVEKEVGTRLEAASYVRAIEALTIPSAMVGLRLDAVLSKWVPKSLLPADVSELQADIFP
jgi:hypothetical protein